MSRSTAHLTDPTPEPARRRGQPTNARSRAGQARQFAWSDATSDILLSENGTLWYVEVKRASNRSGSQQLTHGRGYRQWRLAIWDAMANVARASGEEEVALNFAREALRWMDMSRPENKDVAGREAQQIDPRASIDQLQRDLGLSPRELASALGISTRTLERWRSGIYIVPQGETRERLQDLMDLHRQLNETIVEGPETSDWLNTRRAFLGNLTPIEVIRAGRADRVRDFLTAIDHGIYV
jgi:DNA-binding transcriptional regulator YiaG